MAFTSFNFLVFVLISVGLYYAAPIKYRWLVLLVASYVFYLISSPKTFYFLIIATLVTFIGGILIDNENDNSRKLIASNAELTRDEKKNIKNCSRLRKRRIITAIFIINFGVLAALKYFKYYLQSMNIPGISIAFDNVLIPLGISFYTFQSAAYILDIYREKIKADRNILKFALFMSFFPQIIQGPIARHNQLANQLYEGHKFQYINIAHGAQLILWGFFKKLVVADRVGILVTEVFSNHQQYQGWPVLVALIGYTIQIYGDFSGGIDIARGVARCMGVDMSSNFRRPYFSDSLSEFWRRWHMSLSFWCRDYIFFPISLSKAFGKMGKQLRNVLGDRVGKLFPVLIAQMTTFITIGLWHGAEFKYVAYGLYNGVIIIAALLLEPYFEKWCSMLHIDVTTKRWKAFRIFRTLCIVIIGRVFPKAESFAVAIGMFASIFKITNYVGLKDTIHSMGLSKYDYAVIIIACVVWFIVSLLEEKEEAKNLANTKSIVADKNNESDNICETGAELRNIIDRQPLLIRWTIYILGLLAVLIFGVYGVGYDASTFIYRGF